MFSLVQEEKDRIEKERRDRERAAEREKREKLDEVARKQREREQEIDEKLQRDREAFREKPKPSRPVVSHQDEHEIHP